jgi:hypothetical protein
MAGVLPHSTSPHAASSWQAGSLALEREKREAMGRRRGLGQPASRCGCVHDAPTASRDLEASGAASAPVRDRGTGSSAGPAGGEGVGGGAGEAGGERGRSAGVVRGSAWPASSATWWRLTPAPRRR